MTIAARKLKAYMRAFKLNKSELARELGVHRSQITRWLTGRYQPQHHLQPRINRIFGVVNEWVDK